MNDTIAKSDFCKLESHMLMFHNGSSMLVCLPYSLEKDSKRRNNLKANGYCEKCSCPICNPDTNLWRGSSTDLLEV